MRPLRPDKTFADYLVIGLSPFLIMVLVGSLVFFLIQVFYHGPMQDSVRWLMFWFVLAVVLVARIGIEQGRAYASLYGLALAGATWAYLARTHPAYLLGAVLLAIVWWSANKLTWDCTLIDDEEDASGHGLLTATEAAKAPQTPASPSTPSARKQATRKRLRSRPPEPRGGALHKSEHPLTPSLSPSGGEGVRREGEGESGFTLPFHAPLRKGAPHAPGLWVVIFSVAALPLFGLGQVLVPATDTVSRRLGLAFLLTYLVAALGLLLTTSFLGLRRYLRQRYLRMPTTIALGWIKSGVGVALAVVALTLLLPRPGADYTWKTLAYQIDYQLRRASEYALRFNPAGEGPGRAGHTVQAGGEEEETPSKAGQSAGAIGQQSNMGDAGGNRGRHQPNSPVNQSASAAARSLYVLLKSLLLIAAILVLLWWLFRQRHLLRQILAALGQAISQFLKSLFGGHQSRRSPKATSPALLPRSLHRPFATFRNPFVTQQGQLWPAAQLIAYSFEAVQAWAHEQQPEPSAGQTPREFCQELSEQFPNLATGLERLAYLYSHLAYGQALPPQSDLAPLRELWRQLSGA